MGVKAWKTLDECDAGKNCEKRFRVLRGIAEKRRISDFSTSTGIWCWS